MIKEPKNQSCYNWLEQFSQFLQLIETRKPPRRVKEPLVHLDCYTELNRDLYLDSYHVFKIFNVPC